MKKFFKKHKKTFGIILLLLISILFVVSFFAELSSIVVCIIHNDINKAKDILQGFGWEGMIMIGFMQILYIFSMFLPVRTMQTIAGLSYPLKTALLINFIGNFIGGMIVYYLARHRKLEVSEEELKYNGLERQLGRYNKHKLSVVIFLLYLIPGVPVGIAFYFASKCNISFRRFFILSFISNSIAIVLYTLLGTVTVNYLHHPLVKVLFFVMMILMILSSVIAVAKKYMKKRAPMNKLNENESIQTPETEVK